MSSVYVNVVGSYVWYQLYEHRGDYNVLQLV